MARQVPIDRDAALLDAVDALLYLRANGGVAKAVRRCESGPVSTLAGLCLLLDVWHDVDRAEETKRRLLAAVQALLIESATE